MNFLFYGNGSSGNHGCEAIVRGTVELFDVDGNTYRIQSANPQEDIHYGLGEFAAVFPARHERKKDISFFSAYAKLKLTGNYVDMDGLNYLPGIKDACDNTDIAFSAGGDNYCYGGTGIYGYLNRAYRKRGMKTVLWGCSIEPEITAEHDVAKDLASYDLIAARESITYHAVRKINPQTILAPDPAFFMRPKECVLDQRLNAGNVIGINASPLILKCESEAGIAYGNYKRLIQSILTETDATVALIPHVVWKSNDDRVVLRQLYEDFNGDPRLVLVEDHTAPELKYIISKCSFFVGARTHATIAAYSSCVPTLVVGYSVKARGIARDLFGTEKEYVLPVQELANLEQLKNAFTALYARRSVLAAYLHKKLPSYCSTAYNATAAVKKLAGIG